MLIVDYGFLIGFVFIPKVIWMSLG